MSFSHQYARVTIRAKITRRRRVMMTREQVEDVLAKVRPMLQRDGGDVELVEVEDGIVKVRLTGACGGCPMATMTLKRGIEAKLKEEIPDVKEVVSV